LKQTALNPIIDDDEYDNFYGAITQHMLLQGRLHKKLVACQRYDFSK